jgi:hypothetical protein
MAVAEPSSRPTPVGGPHPLLLYVGSRFLLGFLGCAGGGCRVAGCVLWCVWGSGLLGAGVWEQPSGSEGGSPPIPLPHRDSRPC